MTPEHVDSRRWICHWERVAGPMHNGRVTRSTVWICEYPYRTMRASRPGAECEGCPIWNERQAAARMGALREVSELESLLAH
jgi:hypothetical protein